MNNLEKIISEEIDSFKKSLTEAMSPEFSFKRLMEFEYFDEVYNYCVENLGEPIGEGSSRAVFQMNDHLVLKVAMNNKGLGQNKAEFDNDDTRYKILPSIHGHDSDFRWIVSDYVIPLVDDSHGPQTIDRQADDAMMELVGETWSTFCTFVNTVISSYMPMLRVQTMDERSLLNLIEGNEFFADVYKFMKDTKLNTFDIKSIANWGIAMKGGKPFPVFLDSGFTEDVYKKYYKYRTIK